MKDTPDIRSLLDRYWEGETTLEEERRLRAFFSSENVPEDLIREAALFWAFRAERAVRMPETVRIVRPGWHFWRYGAAAAAVVLLLVAGFWLEQKQPEPTIVHNEPLQKNAPAAPDKRPVADQTETTNNPASTPVGPKKKQNAPHTGPIVKTEEDTCDDPEQALAEIRAALALVSTKMNKSKQTLDKGLQEVDHVDILMKRFGG